MEEIIKIVADHYGVYDMVLFTESRKDRHVLPRQVAIYILMHHCKFSSSKIANKMNKNHSTVLHSVKTVESLMKIYSKTRKDIELIIEKCNEPIKDAKLSICKPCKFRVVKYK